MRDRTHTPRQAQCHTRSRRPSSLWALLLRFFPSSRRADGDSPNNPSKDLDLLLRHTHTHCREPREISRLSVALVLFYSPMSFALYQLHKADDGETQFTLPERGRSPPRHLFKVIPLLSTIYTNSGKSSNPFFIVSHYPGRYKLSLNQNF